MLEQVRAPLRFRPFAVVLTGEGLSMVGDGAFGVALAWLVLQETGSVTALASVLLAQAIPRGLLMPEALLPLDEAEALSADVADELSEAEAEAEALAFALTLAAAFTEASEDESAVEAAEAADDALALAADVESALVLSLASA